MKKLKVIAIAAMMCSCVAVFSGCTLSFDQTTQDNLAQQVELLQEQNQKLQQQNQLLQQQNTNLEQLIQQNNKLTKEEAYAIYKNASDSLILNRNDIWNNLVVTTTQGDDSYDTSYYLTEDNHYVELVSYGSYGYELIYEDSTGVYSYSSSSNTKEKLDVSSLFYVDSLSIRGYTFTYLSEDDIYGYSIKDNGNVQVDFSIVFEDNDRRELMNYKIEIDSLGRLVKCQADDFVEDYYDSEIRYYTFGCEYKYGEVDELDMLVKLQVAKNAQLAN